MEFCELRTPFWLKSTLYTSCPGTIKPKES